MVEKELSKKHLIKQNQSKPVPCWLEIAGKSFGKMMHFKVKLCQSLLCREIKRSLFFPLKVGFLPKSNFNKRKNTHKRKEKEYKVEKVFFPGNLMGKTDDSCEKRRRGNDSAVWLLSCFLLVENIVLICYLASHWWNKPATCCVCFAAILILIGGKA